MTWAGGLYFPAGLSVRSGCLILPGSDTFTQFLGASFCRARPHSLGFLGASFRRARPPSLCSTPTFLLYLPKLCERPNWQGHPNAEKTQNKTPNTWSSIATAGTTSRPKSSSTSTPNEANLNRFRGESATTNELKLKPISEKRVPSFKRNA